MFTRGVTVHKNHGSVRTSVFGVTVRYVFGTVWEQNAKKIIFFLSTSFITPKFVKIQFKYIQSAAFF